MGVFSFMETFFFISLGITFVLILLLVYHFKQRIATLEQKHDTMFEIVNNIVKQLRNIQMNMQHLGEASLPPPPVFHQFDMHRVIHGSNIPQPDAESGSEEGSESGSEEGSESGSEEGSESGSEEGSESGSEEGSESGSEEGSESGSEEGSESGSEKGKMEDIVSAEVNVPIAEPDIIVNDQEAIATEQSSLVEPDDEIIIRKSDSSNDNYKKMSIAALKAAVKEKGLSNDPSKMKKHELVQLLESV